VLLHRHINRLNRRTARLYWFVVALAMCSLFSSLVQIVLALTPPAQRVEIVQKQPDRPHQP
jgi:hypothetical protein